MLNVEEALIISFVVKILKRSVSKVDDNQDNELGKGNGKCYVKDEGNLRGSSKRSRKKREQLILSPRLLDNMR